MTAHEGWSIVSTFVGAVSLTVFAYAYHELGASYIDTLNKLGFAPPSSLDGAPWLLWLYAILVHAFLMGVYAPEKKATVFFVVFLGSCVLAIFSIAEVAASFSLHRAVATVAHQAKAIASFNAEYCHAACFASGSAMTALMRAMQQCNGTASQAVYEFASNETELSDWCFHELGHPEYILQSTLQSSMKTPFQQIGHGIRLDSTATVGWSYVLLCAGMLAPMAQIFIA